MAEQRGPAGRPGPAERPLVLALDVGTTTVRAEAYDARGRAIAGVSASKECPVRTTPDGGVEMDADALFEQTVRAIDEALGAAATVLGSDYAIRAVGTSTFWHSFLGVGADGRPTTPLILWADSRARDEMATLREDLDERTIHTQSGSPIHWMYLPAKLRWLARTRPDAVKATQRWLSFGEYLQTRLLGSSACSVSMASGTGLLDGATQTWDERLLAVLPAGVQHLSQIVQGDEPVGRLTPDYARRWATLRDADWFPAAGDGACSNVGSGCVTRERLALMVGTSGAIRVAWRGDWPSIPPGLWCYRIDGERVVMGGSLTNGGNLYAWMQDTLRLDSPEEVEREIAAMETDAHGLTVLPFLAGERSPGYAANARAAILGMTLATRPVDVLRAGLEAVALRFALIHGILDGVVPEVREVVVTGGALLKSPAWSQIVADALGRPVVASGVPEASSRGAALLALAALGAIESVESVDTPLGEIYEPRPSAHERLQAAQERHRAYYRLLVEGMTP
ncbi:MAG: gluconokinase [Chloroflexi bacterium]|nr:gluconokinase [Chloroflexota bacterium]